MVRLRRARRPRRPRGPRGALPGAATAAVLALSLPVGARAATPWVDLEAGAVASGYDDVRIPSRSEVGDGRGAHPGGRAPRPASRPPRYGAQVNGYACTENAWTVPVSRKAESETFSTQVPSALCPVNAASEPAGL